MKLSIPLSEKYRPKQLKDVVGIDHETASNLFDEQGLKANIIMFGYQGIGKTTTARIYKLLTGCNTMVINTSDERGIDTIRDKVKMFAMTKSTNGKKKIISLEEFDGMTKDAQKSLRPLMEDYSNNVNFIITANYKQKIIDPLISRCVELKILPTRELTLERLKNICEIEKIDIEEKALDLIFDRFNPDIRSMINKIQELSGKEKITQEMIELDKDKVAELFELVKTKKFTAARTWCLNSTWTYDEILKQLYRHILKSNLEPSKKLNSILQIGEGDFRMGLSTDKEVQMSWVLVKLMQVM